jgi:hypothetical protein
MQQRGYGYVSIFASRAEDIYFDSIEEICETLGYIFENIHQLEAQIPDDQIASLRSIFPNYPIRTGFTSGGNKMKWKPQHRIYLRTLRNCPYALLSRKQNDNQMRFTGSLFIESCLFLGFLPGYEQFQDLIFSAMGEIFPNQNEVDAFNHGRQLSAM